MPDNPFKLVIDDSALDKVIEKSKKTSAELISQFTKASENLKAAFGKAFAPDQLQIFVDQVKSKVSALQSNISIKAPIDIDISKISTAAGTVKSLRSEVALLQSTASAAADALQGHFGGVLQGIIQHLKNLQMERKILEDNITASAAKGFKPLPGGGMSGIRIDSLKGEEREAQTALNLLTNVLGKIEGVQNALDKAIVKVQSTPSLAKAVHKVISTSGSQTPLPKTEISKDLREYVTWHQEQTNNLRDALDAQLDNMEHAVAGRRRALPDIKPGMARKQALEILKDQKELDALYKEIAAMRRDPKASQDILGALSGPDLLKIYAKFARGDASVEELNARVLGQIEKARTKMRGLSSKYMRVMEEFPEHIRTSGGEIIIPGLPGQLSVPTTQQFSSSTSLQGMEKEIANLKKLGDQSDFTKARIKDLEGQLAHMQAKPITFGPPTQAGVKSDVALPRKYYKAEDYHPEGAPGSVEAIEEFHQTITGLDLAYSASAKSAEMFHEELTTTGAIVKQAAEQHKPLLSMFGTFDSLAGRASQLFGGVKRDASEMPSIVEKIKQINSIIYEPVMRVGPESFDFAERLKGSIGNATGYVKRELSDTTFKAQETLFKFGKVIEVMGDDIAKPWKKVIDHIVGVKDAAGKTQGIGPQFRLGDQTAAGEKVPYLKAFEDRIGRIQSLMLTLDTAPAETLPKLEKEISSLSLSLTNVGNHYRKINTEASEMSGAFRVQPLVNDLRNIFTSPELSGHQLSNAKTVVGELNTKFDQMVKYAPELEPLRKQFRGMADDFMRSKGFSTAEKSISEIKKLQSEADAIQQKIEILRTQKPKEDYQHESNLDVRQYGQTKLTRWQSYLDKLQKQYDDAMAKISAKKVSLVDQSQIKDAYDKFATGLEPFARQLNFSQVISDALMQLARLARGAGDVGRNSSMMTDNIIKMVELLHESSTVGLTSSGGDKLRKIMSDMDRYTIRLNSDHLPAVKALSTEYRTFHDNVDKVVGKMLKTTERGALPEIISSRFAPPERELAMPLEDWIEKMSGGKRIGKLVGNKWQKEMVEIFVPPGHGEGKPLSVADMFGTGRLELIDQVVAKTQSYGRAIEFASHQLSTPGEFNTFYQPVMKNAEALGFLIQKLREAIKYSAELSPRMSSVALSLDTAQTSLMHATRSFGFMKNSVESLEKSGGVVTPEWLAKTQSGLSNLTKTFTSGTPDKQYYFEGGKGPSYNVLSLEQARRAYQGRLKNILKEEDSDPSQIYSAVKEAMKLPSAIGKEPIASKGIGELLFGGDKKSLMSSIPFDRLMQIKGALGEYVTEIVESGFGFKSIQRARISVGNLFKEIGKEINQRRIEAYNKGTELPSVAPEIMPSRWQQETPKLAVHMKGAMKAIFEGIEEASPETYPGMEKVTERASNWTLKQIESRMGALKRKVAQLHRELSSELVPGELDVSASSEKMIVKGLNYEHALTALDKAKQNVIFKVRKQEAAQGGKSLTTPTGTPEALASVAAGEDLVMVSDSVKGSKKAVVSSIDEMTQAKVAALRRQIAEMKGVGVGQAAGAIEKEVVDQLQQSAKSGGANAVVAKLFDFGGGGESAAVRNIRGLVDPFTMLNDQIETIGHAINKQGQPLAVWGELAKAARQQVFGLLNEVAKTGISTNSLDAQVEKFNSTASDDKKVKTFSQLQEHITDLKQNLATAIPEYQAALESGDESRSATVKRELLGVVNMLNKAFMELERTVAATMNTEFLIDDLHKREITTIRELGQAYRMAKLESSESMGPYGAASTAKVGEAAFAGRGIAAQSLITSAWKTTGEAPGGMFSGIGAPAATIDDLFQKLLSTPKQLTQLGSGMRRNVEAFRELNASFDLGIVEPKGLNATIANFERIHKSIGDAGLIAPTLPPAIMKGLAPMQEFMRGVLTSLDTTTRATTESRFSQNLVAGIQKSRDEARSLIKEIEMLIKDAELASTRKGTIGAQQTRIRLFETIKQKQEQLGETGLALERDKEAPAELKGAVADVGVRLAGASKNVLSIWERLTNTVKTTRNNFADLFMYQVRWYTSMMLFWGVINKVGETFKGLISTQHEIQRAVRAMREESGELTQHWQRLEKIATIHIFDNMIKWATDAKMAGEALWQLGSAGLTATESIAALGPVLGLIRATEGDPQETTKIVAGVYNTLSESIEGNVAASTKFRIITDVMSRVFKDHQVELSELNQGYRFAITSADMAGLSFYELSGILGVLNDNMIKGSRAGRGLQQVLTHIAKEPYEIAASFIELGKHMGVPAEAMAKLASPEIRKMGTMELLREFAKIAQASGKSIESLGRIMESFDMIGGRTLAPLLLHFEKVDKSVKDLLLGSAGATESMASRMSTTIQANARRIASYFQAAVYPVISGVHAGLASIMNFVGGTASALQSLQSKAVTGSFKFIGMEGMGTFVDSGLKAAVMLGTLALLSGQLPGKFNLIGNALAYIGNAVANSLSVWSMWFAGVSGETPMLIALLTRLRAAVMFVVGSLKVLFSLEGWHILTSTWSAGAGVISGAIAQIVTNFRTLTIGQAILATLTGGVKSLAGAFGLLALAFKAHPILMAIGLIATAIGGLAYYFKVWKSSYDDLVTAAIESNAKFQERLGQLEQKSVAAYHALSMASDAKSSFDELTKGMDGTTEASKEQKTAFDDYVSSLLITDHTTKINGISVQTLKDRLEELTPEIERNTSAFRGHQNAIASDKELLDAYADALKKQREAVKGAEEKKERIGGTLSTEDPRQKWGVFTGLGSQIVDIWNPGYAKKEAERRQKEYDEMMRDASDGLSDSQKKWSDIIQGRAASITKSPLQYFIDKMSKAGTNKEGIKKSLEEALTIPKGIDLRDWTPKLSGIPEEDWSKFARQAAPPDKEIQEIAKNQTALRYLVGEGFAKEIEKLDLSKAADIVTAKRLMFLGGITSHSKTLIANIMETLKIDIGVENARKKAQDATDAANEALLKSQSTYHKEWTEMQLRLGEARVAAIEKGYSAELFATNAFMMESRRLDLEYENTKKEFELKRSKIEREHPEMGREQHQAKLDQTKIDEQVALMKIDQQRYELIKKVGEIAQKSWQEGEGETLKYNAAMKNVQARNLEAEAAEKIAKIERDIASSVRASSQEVQEAHKLKMEAFAAELAAKKLDLQYTLQNEKLKLDAEINALKNPEKARTPEQQAWAEQRITTLERQRSHAESLYTANINAANMEANRKAREEERRDQKMHLDVLVQHVKVALGEIQDAQVQARSQMTGGSLGIGINAPIQGTLTSTFYDDRKGRPQGHRGGDIGAPAGTPFYAPTDLDIRNTRDLMSDGKTGGMVWGVDAQGVWHKFHHVKPGVHAGQHVKVGEQLGVLSDIKGPHLDYKMQDAQGNYIDWMTAAGLKKGARIGGRITGQIPMTAPVTVKPGIEGGESETADLASAMQRLMAEIDRGIKESAPKAKGKFRPIVTELLNGLKDMQIEPDQLQVFQSVFDSLEVMWQKLGLKMKKFYPLILDSYKKMFERGETFDIPVLVKYSDAARKAGETEEQIRKRIFEVDKVAFENENNWTAEKFAGLMKFISTGAEATGISGKKLYSYLFSEVFSPSKLQVMLDSDIGLMDQFYQQLSQLGRDLSGGVPVKVMKSFETAIKGIISSGEELDPEKYNALVRTLSQISSINLKEASDSIEKYWQSISNMRAMKTTDLGKMQSDMMRFGATSDEVWKAIGEVADVQIRRMYASWDKGAQGMKGDMSSLKELGEAFWWGMAKGVADFASKLKDPIRRLASEITEILTTMQSTLESVLEDSLKGDFKGWNEYLTKFGESMIKIASKNISEMMMKSLTDWVQDLMGGEKQGKPGTMTQEKAEGFGKAAAEANTRAFIEQTKDGTLKVVDHTKRTADGVEQLVKQGERGPESKSSTAEGKSSTAEGKSAAGGATPAFEPTVTSGGLTRPSKQSSETPVISRSSTDPKRPGEAYVTRSYRDKEGNLHETSQWEKTGAGTETGDLGQHLEPNWPPQRTDEEKWDEANAAREKEIELRKASEDQSGQWIPLKKLEAQIKAGKDSSGAFEGTPTPAGEQILDEQGNVVQPSVWSRFTKFLSDAAMFAHGGVVKGSGNADTVPAFLTPGEVVLSRAMVKRFAEGGDVENPLQGIMSSVGEMVQGMLAPLTQGKSARAQQIAQIGEGSYGGTFEQQAQWDDQFEAVRNQYRQQDAQKYAQYQQQQLQQMMQGGGFFSSIFGSLFGKAAGGLVQAFANGGLVQYLASGGSPILQKNINPSLYNAHVTSEGKLYSSWPDNTPQKTDPWWKRQLPWLIAALPLLMMLGKKKDTSGAEKDTAALKEQLDTLKTPDLGGLPDKNLFAGLMPGKGDDFGLPGFSSMLRRGTSTPSESWGSLPVEFRDGGFIQYLAAGGPILTTRSESERSWQNMGHTSTVYTGGSTFWQALRPYLLMAVPLLMYMLGKKKSSGGADTQAAQLSETLQGMKTPQLDGKTTEQMYKEFLGGNDKSDIGSAWTKYLEGKNASDFGKASIDKSLFDTTDIKASLTKAAATPSESGGITGWLGNLFGGGKEGGGFLGSLGSLGSSLWGGIKDIGSSLWGGLKSIGGLFFADGGLIGGIGSAVGSIAPMVGSFLGPIGSIAGGLVGMLGKLFGGLFGGKEKEPEKLAESGGSFTPLDFGGSGGIFSNIGGSTLGFGKGITSGVLPFAEGGEVGGGLFSNLFTGVGGLFKGLLGGVGSMFGLSDEITGRGSKGGLGSGTGLSGMFGGLGNSLSGLGSGLMGGLGSLGSGILGVGKSLFSGIGSIFGFADGGIVDMFSPSNLVSTLSTGWEKDFSQLGPDLKYQTDQVLVQAKAGASDVAEFMKGKPNMLESLKDLSGSATAGTSYYRDALSKMVINVDPLSPGMVNFRDQVANDIFHESAHVLTKSGRSLAPFLNQIDPAKTMEWAKEQVKLGKIGADQVEQWSDPYEVMARGVAGHLQTTMNPKTGIDMSQWPSEYNQLFAELSKGVTTGKMPQSPGGIGLLATLSRMGVDIKSGRLPQAIFGYATGGTIPGSSNEDVVPAMLTPGEFVVNRHTVGMFGPQFFHALQDMAKMRGSASPESVLSGTHSALKFATGGSVPKLPRVPSQVTEQKITVANVMDEESVGQFLNTKKYGEVLVNKLGSGVTRRMMGGQGI